MTFWHEKQLQDQEDKLTHMHTCKKKKKNPPSFLKEIQQFSGATSFISSETNIFSKKLLIKDLKNINFMQFSGVLRSSLLFVPSSRALVSQTPAKNLPGEVDALYLCAVSDVAPTLLLTPQPHQDGHQPQHPKGTSQQQR